MEKQCWSLHLLLVLGCYCFQAILSMSEGCIQSERLALVKFKAGLEDPHQLLSSWTGEDCCAWRGIHCDNETWHVVSLDLQYHHLYDGLNNGGRLSGEINLSLLALKHLNYLDLSSNNFKRTEIPSFIGSLSGLSYLNLSNAGFIGRIPPQLGNLTRLRYLDLNSFYNMYGLHADGNLQWLSSLSSLQFLDMSGVNLARVSSDWFHSVSMLPLLSVLILPNCQLHWLLPSPPLYLNLTNSLTSIDLSNNQINSTFPLWILNCSNLVHLDLWLNHFHGVIPEAIGNLKALEVLQLGHNDFVSPLPKSIGDFCNLHTLDISYNNLEESTPLADIFSGCVSGSIEILNLRSCELRDEMSSWLGILKKITTLDLSRNSLYGQIPASIQSLSNLRTLYLGHNQLNGTLPESIGQLPEIKVLDIAGNLLTGVVSEAHLANLSSLDTLSMSYNSLVVNISKDWVPPFQMQALAFGSCQLGPEFPAWFRTQKDYSKLDLSNSGIVGALPDWFWDLSDTIAFLDLSNNQITGTIPKSLQFFYIGILNLSSNKFEGPLPSLPSYSGYVDFSDNLFSGPLLPILGDTLTSPRLVFLSNNLLNGTFPTTICKLEVLQIIDVSNNLLSGELPTCWADLPSLAAMNLANNSLTGKIPDSIGSLRLLEVLHLGNNNFSGEIPVSLRDCKSLVTLDLGGNRLTGKIPRWIGGSMPLLRILRLRSNFLHGDIPEELSKLSSLQILDIADNSLSGIIPESFGKFSAMQLRNETGHSILSWFQCLALSSVGNYSHIGYTESLLIFIKGRQLTYTKTLQFVKNIDLSNNQFSGEIPKQLGNLHELQSLNLSGNHLSGRIPDSIGGLISLESFDLSRNNLVGEISPSISVLTSLSHLNLSYNNLTGRIPVGSQLQTLDDQSIYIGNHGLCGPPLTVECDSNETLVSGDEGDESDEPEMLWVFYGCVVGYVFSLLATIVVFMSSEARGKVYLDLVDYFTK